MYLASVTLLAVVSRPARGAGTPSSHCITARIVFTDTLHLAPLTETSTWTCWFKGVGGGQRNTYPFRLTVSVQCFTEQFIYLLFFLWVKMLLILTVLADSTHEPWRTDARPIVFITHTSILTAWTGFCAAQTPESLWTYWETKWHHTFSSPKYKILKNGGVFKFTVLNKCIKV